AAEEEAALAEAAQEREVNIELPTALEVADAGEGSLVDDEDDIEPVEDGDLAEAEAAEVEAAEAEAAEAEAAEVEAAEAEAAEAEAAEAEAAEAEREEEEGVLASEPAEEELASEDDTDEPGEVGEALPA